METVSQAAPEIRAIDLTPSRKQDSPVRFPASIARVEDVEMQPSKTARTVYLIEDSHGNESGQINLARTLDLLMDQDHRVTQLFVEGGFGDVSLSYLREGTDEMLRRREAMAYLRKGLMHGEDLLALTSDKEFFVWGVEDRALYEKAVASYKRVASSREAHLRYLGKVKMAIESLKGLVWGKALQDLDTLRESYLAGETSLTAYVSELTLEARRRHLSLLGYTELSSFERLRDEESAIDFRGANEELRAAIASLTAEDRNRLQAQADSDAKAAPFGLLTEDGTSGYYALLEEMLSDHAAAYPELNKYLSYLHHASDLHPERLLKEMVQLEKRIEEALAANDDERELLECRRMLKDHEKLMRLSMTPAEYRDYRERAESFTIRNLTGFLNRKIAETGRMYERTLFVDEPFEAALKDAESFYRLTVDRDEAMLAAMISKMDKDGIERAILIAGGYHAPNLKRTFQEKGISFVSIRPQVYQESNIRKYENVLLNQSLPVLGSPAGLSTVREIAFANTPWLPVLESGLGARPGGARLSESSSPARVTVHDADLKMPRVSLASAWGAHSAFGHWTGPNTFKYPYSYYDHLVLAWTSPVPFALLGFDLHRLLSWAQFNYTPIAGLGFVAAILAASPFVLSHLRINQTYALVRKNTVNYLAKPDAAAIDPKLYKLTVDFEKEVGWAVEWTDSKSILAYADAANRRVVLSIGWIMQNASSQTQTDRRLAALHDILRSVRHSDDRELKNGSSSKLRLFDSTAFYRGYFALISALWGAYGISLALTLSQILFSWVSFDAWNHLSKVKSASPIYEEQVRLEKEIEVRFPTDYLHLVLKALKWRERVYASLLLYGDRDRALAYVTSKLQANSTAVLGRIFANPDELRAYLGDGDAIDVSRGLMLLSIITLSESRDLRVTAIRKVGKTQYVNSPLARLLWAIWNEDSEDSEEISHELKEALDQIRRRGFSERLENETFRGMLDEEVPVMVRAKNLPMILDHMLQNSISLVTSLPISLEMAGYIRKDEDQVEMLRFAETDAKMKFGERVVLAIERLEPAEANDWYLVSRPAGPLPFFVISKNRFENPAGLPESVGIQFIDGVGARLASFSSVGEGVDEKSVWKSMYDLLRVRGVLEDADPLEADANLRATAKNSPSVMEELAARLWRTGQFSEEVGAVSAKENLSFRDARYDLWHEVNRYRQSAGARLAGVMRERTQFIIRSFLDLAPEATLNNNYFAEQLGLPNWLVSAYTYRLEKMGFLAYERLSSKEYFLHPSISEVRADPARWRRFVGRVGEILDANNSDGEFYDALSREIDSLKEANRDAQAPSGGFRMVTALIAQLLDFSRRATLPNSQTGEVSQAEGVTDGAQRAASDEDPSDESPSHEIDRRSRAQHIFRWIASQPKYDRGFKVGEVARDVREGKLILHSLRFPYRRLDHQASVYQAVEQAIWFEGIHRGLIDKNEFGTFFRFTPAARERFKSQSGARLAGERSADKKKELPVIDLKPNRDRSVWSVDGSEASPKRADSVGNAPSGKSGSASATGSGAVTDPESASYRFGRYVAKAIRNWFGQGARLAKVQPAPSGSSGSNEAEELRDLILKLAKLHSPASELDAIQATIRRLAQEEAERIFADVKNIPYAPWLPVIVHHWIDDVLEQGVALHIPWVLRAFAVETLAYFERDLSIGTSRAQHLMRSTVFLARSMHHLRYELSGLLRGSDWPHALSEIEREHLNGRPEVTRRMLEILSEELLREVPVSTTDRPYQASGARLADERRALSGGTVEYDDAFGSLRSEIRAVRDEISAQIITLQDRVDRGYTDLSSGDRKRVLTALDVLMDARRHTAGLPFSFNVHLLNARHYLRRVRNYHNEGAARLVLGLLASSEASLQRAMGVLTEESLVTFEEAAERSGVNLDTLYSARQDGRLSPDLEWRTGGRSVYFFHRDRVEAWRRVLPKLSLNKDRIIEAIRMIDEADSDQKAAETIGSLASVDQRAIAAIRKIEKEMNAQKYTRGGLALVAREIGVSRAYLSARRRQNPELREALDRMRAALAGRPSGARLSEDLKGHSRSDFLRRVASPLSRLSDADRLRRLADEAVREVYEAGRGQLDSDYVAALLGKVEDGAMRRLLIELYGDQAVVVDRGAESAATKLLRLSASALQGETKVAEDPIAFLINRSVGRRGFLGFLASTAVAYGMPAPSLFAGESVAAGAEAGSALFRAAQVPSDLITDHLLRMIRHFMDPRTVHVGGFGYQELAGIPIRPFWNARDLADGLASQRAYFLEQLPQTVRLIRPDVQAWVEKSAAGFPLAAYGPVEWRHLDTNPFAPAFKEVLGQARVLKNSVLSLSGTTIQQLRAKEIFSDPAALDAEESRIKTELQNLLPDLWEAQRAEEKVWSMEGFRILTPRQRRLLDRLGDLEGEVVRLRAELESIRNIRSVIGSKRSIAETLRDELSGARLSMRVAQETNYIGAAVRVKPGESRRALNHYVGSEGRLVHVAMSREQLEAGQNSGFYAIRIVNGAIEYLDETSEAPIWRRYDFLREMQIAVDPGGRLYLIENDLAERLPQISFAALRGDPVVQTHRSAIAEIAAIARKYPAGDFIIHAAAGEHRIAMNEMRAGDRAIQQVRQLKGDSLRIRRQKKDGRYEYHVWPLGARLSARPVSSASIMDLSVKAERRGANYFKVGESVGVVRDSAPIGSGYVWTSDRGAVFKAQVTATGPDSVTLAYLSASNGTVEAAEALNLPLKDSAVAKWKASHKIQVKTYRGVVEQDAIPATAVKEEPSKRTESVTQPYVADPPVIYEPEDWQKSQLNELLEGMGIRPEEGLIADLFQLVAPGRDPRPTKNEIAASFTRIMMRHRELGAVDASSFLRDLDAAVTLRGDAPTRRFKRVLYNRLRGAAAFEQLMEFMDRNHVVVREHAIPEEYLQNTPARLPRSQRMPTSAPVLAHVYEEEDAYPDSAPSWEVFVSGGAQDDAYAEYVHILFQLGMVLRVMRLNRDGEVFSRELLQEIEMTGYSAMAARILLLQHADRLRIGIKDLKEIRQDAMEALHRFDQEDRRARRFLRLATSSFLADEFKEILRLYRSARPENAFGAEIVVIDQLQQFGALLMPNGTIERWSSGFLAALNRSELPADSPYKSLGSVFGARLAEEGGRPESLRIEDVIRRQGYENGTLRVDYRVGMRVGVVADIRELGVAYVEVPHEWRVLLAKITKIDRKNGTVNYRFLDRDGQVIQSILPQRAPMDAEHLGEWIWKGGLSGARLAEVRKYSEYQARGMDFGLGRVFHRRAGESTIVHPDGVMDEKSQIRIDALSLDGASAQIRIGGRGFSPRTVSLSKGQALEWVGDERIAIIMTGVSPSRMKFVLVRPASWRVRQENGHGARLATAQGIFSPAFRIERFKRELIGLAEGFRKRHDLSSKERRMIQGLAQSALDLHRSEFARKMPQEKRRQWFDLYLDIRKILNYQNEALAPLAVRQLDAAQRKLERILDSHDGRLITQPEAYLSIPVASTVSGVGYSTLQWALDRGVLKPDVIQRTRKATASMKTYFLLRERVQKWAKLREAIMTRHEIASRHLTEVLKVIDGAASDEEAEKTAAERFSSVYILREALRNRIGSPSIRSLARETGVDIEKVAALKRRPDIAALFDEANARAAGSTPSGARLADGPVMDRFFTGIADLITSSEALAYETDRRVRVYSLLRDTDALIVTYEDEAQGPQRKVYDLATDRLRALSAEEATTAARSEEALTAGLEKLLSLNGLGASPAASPGTPVRLMLHLDSLESFDKAALSNLFYHWKARLSEGSVVVLVGSKARLEVAQRLVREMSVKNFVSEGDLSPDQRTLPDAHLATQGYLSQNAALRSEYPGARWLFLERSKSRETAVFAFAPIESLLELSARGQEREAFDLFLSMTPEYRGKMRLEDFLEILNGNEAIAQRFPIPALLRVDFREAVRLYRLSRQVQLSA